MPSIPTYQQRVRPAPARQPTLSPESFGAQGGRAMQALGEGLQRTTENFAASWQKRQERKDADAAFQAEVQLQNDWSQVSTDLRNRRGNNAEGISQEAAAWWKQAQQKYERGLTDNSRQILAKSAARTRLSGLGQILDHQERELEKAHDESWAASKQVAISTAAQNPTPDNIDATVQDLRAKNAYQAQRKGWGADVLQVTNNADITNLHENVIDGLLNAPGGGLAAEAYFEQHKEDIDGTRHDELQKVIRRAAIDDEAELIAARLDNLSGSAALRQIQQIKDPDLRKAAKREWSANFNIKQQIKNAGQREAKDAVWSTINAGERPTEGQLRGLSPAEYARVKNYFEARASGQVSKSTGLVHSKIDSLENIEKIEGMIEAGDIRTRQQLEEYAPYVRDSTFMSMLKDVEKQSEVPLTDLRRAFAERKGVSATKILSEHREEWDAFKDYMQDRVDETRRPQDMDQWADQWFMKGYGIENRMLRRDPRTLGAAVLAGRDDFRLRTPDDVKQDTAVSLELTKRMLGDRAPELLPTDKRAVDGFYTNYYTSAKQWLEAHQVQVTPATIAAVSALEAAGKQVTPDTVAGVLEQLVQQEEEND